MVRIRYKSTTKHTFTMAIYATITYFTVIILQIKSTTLREKLRSRRFYTELKACSITARYE